MRVDPSAVEKGKELAKRYAKTASDEEAIKIGCYIDPLPAQRVYHFFQTKLKHTKDPYANKPFVLIDWQWRDIVFPLYGWRMPDGSRRFTRCGVGIPKKNGKSTFTAGLALYECENGGEGSKVYVGAYDRKQASIIFDECCDMAERNRKFARQFKIRRSYRTIRHKKTQSVIEPISSDAWQKEGLNPSTVIIDELHTQPNRLLWNALRYAMAARTNPLSIWLSTAGEVDETSLWHEQFQLMRKIKSGEVIDVTVLPVMYEASETDDPFAVETWKKANPSFGITLNERTFAQDATDAKNNPAEMSIFKRYRLNIATRASSAWLAHEMWDAGKIEIFKDPAWLAEFLIDADSVYAGLDLSLAHDISALTVVVAKGAKRFAIPYFWLPESVLEDTKFNFRNIDRFKFWKESGHIKFTDRLPIIDYDVMVADIKQLVKLYGISFLAIDKWNEQRIAHELKANLDRKLKCEVATISTASKNMILATAELTRLIKSGDLHHPNDPVLNWMFGNVVIETLPNGNQMLSKAKVKDKIDGIYALAVGLAVEMHKLGTLKPKSKYADGAAEPIILRG